MEGIYSKSYYSLTAKEKERLEKENISQRNKALIKAFLEFISSTGSGDKRQTKLSWELRRIAILLKEDFDKTTKQGIQRVVNHFNTLDKYSEATKSDYKRGIKQFYKWFKDEDKKLYNNDIQIREQALAFYKFIEKDISISYKKEQIDPNTVISDEDITLIVKSSKSIKEIALIKLLHETGVRVGELLGMKIKDIYLNGVSARINVNGKTGRRAIPITTCVPSLTKWLELHPFKDNPDSYLWIGENPRKMYAPLRYAGVVKILSRSFKKVGLKKKANPHWFRHSRASLLAPNLTEVLLCKYMGWTIGSRQVKTYCHLCTEQLEDAYLKIQGIETNKQENIKKVTKCSCGTINENSARYCYKCGRPLSVEIAIQDEELVKSETDKTIKLLMEIMKDPELFKKFQEFKQKAFKA